MIHQSNNTANLNWHSNSDFIVLCLGKDLGLFMYAPHVRRERGKLKSLRRDIYFDLEQYAVVYNH